MFGFYDHDDVQKLLKHYCDQFTNKTYMIRAICFIRIIVHSFRKVVIIFMNQASHKN